jgi:hypothetical protein
MRWLPVTRRISRRQLLAVSATAPIALAGHSWPVSAQYPVPKPRGASPDRMATVGIVAGQLARLSVFFPGDPENFPDDPENYPNDPENFPSDPENFRVDFFGIDGKLLATGDGRVMPGQGAFLDFDLASHLRRGQRLQVHCIVTLPKGYENQIGATLELFDAKTGATAIPSRPRITPAPSDEMNMGTVGVVNGQIARLSVFRHDESQYPFESDNYKIEIYGLDGTLLASDGGVLLHGQGAFYDYDLAATARKGERVQFHAIAVAICGHEMGALIEVLDAKTGVTQFSARPSALGDCSNTAV